MAAPLRHRTLPLARALLSPSRSLSTDTSLVELKPGEIGIVSGIPQEHLRRKAAWPSVLHEVNMLVKEYGSSAAYCESELVQEDGE